VVERGVHHTNLTRVARTVEVRRFSSLRRIGAGGLSVLEEDPGNDCNNLLRSG
jgi:hypothetical protein